MQISTVNSHVLVSNRYVYKTCSIPIKTIWPSLSVNHDELVADVDSEATFTCTFQFLLNYETIWEWHTTPPIELSRGVSSTNTFTVRKVLAKDNGTTISCFALFRERWFQAETKLFVRDGSISYPTTEEFEQTLVGGYQSTGWIAAFSIVLIVMIAAIGTAAFFFCKFHKSYTLSNNNDTQIGHIPKSAVQLDTSGGTYMELQKPAAEAKMSDAKHSFQQNPSGETYTDLRKPEELKMSDKKETNREVNDYLYENEGAGGKPDDSIYDYAENDEEEEQLYTNDKVIVSRYNKR